MKHGRQLVLFVLALTLLASVGCVKKKPHLPAQANAPAYPIATPLPGEISETATASEEPEPQEETTATKEEPVPKPPKRRRRKPAPPPPAQTATTPANNTVAMAHPPANPAEPPADMAIAADVTSAQLLQQKQNTAHLLDETEKTISGLNRSLSQPEKEMLAQIRSYVSQSRKATTDGDFERAYNLATKAHLLSDALVKQ